MSSSAHVVVIGAGVVRASVAYHLAELGWTDEVVVDQPRTSSANRGSTRR